MNALRAVPIVLLAWLLAACMQIALVPPGQTTVNGVLRVQSAIAWSRVSNGDRESWTVDGMAVNELFFVTGLEDGGTIFAVPDATKAPKFSKAMTPVEITDLVQASLASKQITDFRIRALRPYSLGGAEGFRFEFSYTTNSGLDMEGIAAGVVRKDALNLVLYRGARIYFFGKYRDEAERIVSSARFI